MEEDEEIPLAEEDVEALVRNTKERSWKGAWNLFYRRTHFKITCKPYEQWEKLKWLIAGFLSNPLPESIPVYPVSYQLQKSDSAILVAGCGNSSLSEFLFGSGFQNLISVDFSDAVIDYMSGKCYRTPTMKWLVMDLNDMHQFQDESFDAIVDIGGLDSVVDNPSDGINFGHLYLSEVKRLLKAKGRYVCMTLGESKVIDIILPKFSFGWKVNTYSIYEEENVFILVASKLADHVVLEISTFRSPEFYDHQAAAFYEAIVKENYFRALSMDAFNSFIPLEDVRENLKELDPGRMLRLILGQPGTSSRLYNCIVLDSQQNYRAFSKQMVVFVVPKLCNFELINTSSKEQWRYLEYFNTARLLIVMVSPTNDFVSNEDIKSFQKDVSHFVNKIAPVDCDDHKIMYVNATDSIHTTTVHQVESDFSGLIAVDNFYYYKNPSTRPIRKGRFRCLTVASIERSRVLMTRGDSLGGSLGLIGVDHSHLESTHHTAIISGLMLMCLHWIDFSTQGRGTSMQIARMPHKIKTVVIGLGAGILPMFINKFLPQFTTEVIEPDSVILDVSRKYFYFTEDEHLKVCIANQIQFVEERANCISAAGSDSSKIDVLILDLHSPCPTSDLVSPPVEFTERPFLLNIKKALSDDGFLVINLVVKSAKVKSSMYERLKEVFSSFVYLPIEDDSSEVIFAFNSDSPTTEQELSQACDDLEQSMSRLEMKWGPEIVDASKLFKPLIR